MSSNADSILLHSRIRASAEATPAIAADIRSRGWTFDVSGTPVPVANWMSSNPEWRLFLGFHENWRTQRPFPRGVVTP